MKNYEESQALAELWGHVAEYCCMGLLVLKGYSVLARRYRNPFGEIDIIARRGRLIAFIEVKARANRAEALASITRAKQERIARAASGYMSGKPYYAHHALRFDAMVITSPWNIHHLRDAWRLHD